MTRRTNVLEARDETTGQPRPEWLRGTCPRCGGAIIASYTYDGETITGVEMVCWNTLDKTLEKRSQDR